MELNTKVKELEDELKVLKAEIRNVLLDIREVVLDKTNPLSEEHESAFLRMDLNTTARSIASDAAAREAGNAANLEDEKPEPEEEKPEDDKDGTDEPTDSAEPPSKGKGSRKGKGKGSKPEAAPPDPADIPTMYRASVPTGASATGLAAWVADAMGVVGPQQVDRVITIHRLCGTLAPNISEALAHLQELIRSSSEEEQPHWLKVLQDLDRLAAS